MRTDDLLGLTEVLQPSLGRERPPSFDLEVLEPGAAASRAAPYAAAAAGIMQDGDDIDQV